MDAYPDEVTVRLVSTPEQLAAAVVGTLPASRATVEVVDYDPAWRDAYIAVRDRLASALSAVAVSIEHVGSTSVEGLPAKPIIDIDVLVADAEDEAQYVPALESLGMQLVIREPWWHGHRMFVDAAGAVNVHVWPDGAAEPIRHALFRDWLRAHPQDRALYASAKRDLGRALRDRPDDYNFAKNEVIDAIYARIFASRPQDSSH